MVFGQTYLYKLVFHHQLDLLVGAFIACLKEDFLPFCLKITRFTLISKGKGDHELPLCISNTGGKVLITNRLAEAIRATGDLSLRQFGFRTRRTTLDSVILIVDAVHQVEVHCRRFRWVLVSVEQCHQFRVGGKTC